MILYNGQPVGGSAQVTFAAGGGGTATETLIPLYTFYVGASFADIVVGYSNAISPDVFNRPPTVGEKFLAYCDSSDGIQFFMTAMVTNPKNDAGNVEFEVVEWGITECKGGTKGVSPTVAVTEIENGHTVTITDVNGAKSFDVLNGANGTNGKDGTSVTVSSVTTSTEDGGENVVTFSDGNTLIIKNGSKGSDGVTISKIDKSTQSGGTTTVTFSDGNTIEIKNGYDGEMVFIGDDGYWYIGSTNTGVKAAGTDGKTPYIQDGYWYIDGNNTGVKARGDDASIEVDPTYQPNSKNAQSGKAVAQAIASLSQLKPEFVESIDDCTDQTKLYVLPDGDIYAYRETEQEVSTEVLKTVGYQDEKRINSSGAIVTQSSSSNYSDVTGYIPCKVGDIIRVENMTIPSAYTAGAYHNQCGMYRSDKSWIKTIGLNNSTTENVENTDLVVDNEQVVQFTIKKEMVGSEDVAYIVISAKEITKQSKVYVIRRETVLGFANTGLAFVPANYEDRIIALEDETADHEKRMKILEAGNHGEGVPEYWLTELETKADEIQQAMETAGRNKSAFLWYTDAHWLTNSKMSPVLLKYLIDNTPMNKVNFGGDIINDPNPHDHDTTKYAYDWRKRIADLPNHHSVLGNHDVNHRTTDVSNMAYAQLLAHEESPDMVVGGDSYYYIDNPAEKTRYLYLSFLSNHSAMVAQGEFIVDALSSVKEGWHIVAIAHRWFQYTVSSAPTEGAVPQYETDILSVFDAYNERATRAASQYFVSQNFANSKGKVEFCIGGHIHVDYGFETAGGIPVIITASDTNQERSLTETEDSGEFGTTTESAVYGIIADYTAKKITVVGVGRGTSREINLNY